ncbi:BrnT family toxin [Marinivivus vitaminiproducens]|uniref:BrnT family toxin n=1 Tax=Marinivivus vitaminiproducens TaxID=3035935 RepID=UPI003FA138A7
MRLGFDPAKSECNRRERSIPFERAVDLDGDRALVFEDLRHDYGEVRMIALAHLLSRLHVVCYCQRGDVRWIISFRKANRREVRLYEQATDG